MRLSASRPISSMYASFFPTQNELLVTFGIRTIRPHYCWCETVMNQQSLHRSSTSSSYICLRDVTSNRPYFERCASNGSVRVSATHTFLGRVEQRKWQRSEETGRASEEMGVPPFCCQIEARSMSSAYVRLRRIVDAGSSGWIVFSADDEVGCSAILCHSPYVRGS